MSHLRVALINFSPQYGKVDVNLAFIERQIQSLVSDDVQLVCFPEMCLTGYSRSARILGQARGKESDMVTQLTHLASITGIAVAAGMPEWEPVWQRYYITQVCCLPDGMVFQYRKIHLSPRESAIFHPGADLGVFRFLSFTFGLQLCYDAHFPEFGLAQALAGAQAILVCSASPMGDVDTLRRNWLRYLPARAYDTGSYVLTCNQHGVSPSGLVFSGLAMAFDPNGDLIDETHMPDQPLIIELDAGWVDKARQRRSFLRLRRPELYHYLLG